MLGVAEVQAVHDGVRPGAGAGDVEGGLGDDERCASSRVEGAPAGVAVGAQGDGSIVRREPRRLESQHGGVAARPFDRVEEQLVVVLAPDPREVGGQRQQVGAAVDRRG